MGNYFRASDVEDAVELAMRLRDQGRYDWFRGQVKNYDVFPRLFEFDWLARVMARELSPAQVLMRPSLAAFFSAARIPRIGPPYRWSLIVTVLLRFSLRSTRHLSTRISGSILARAPHG